MCGKKPYTKREAQTARNQRLRSHHNRPKLLRIYPCPECNAWHLTHQPKRS